MVLFLLTCRLDELPSSIDQRTLVKFRNMYGESEFTCRFHDCPFHSDGFESVQKRNDHEMSHVKSLRCAVPTCDFFARGFASRTGLLKHNRKYHPVPSEEELPEFVPVRLPTPPPPPAVPPLLKAPNGPIPRARNPTPPAVVPSPPPVPDSPDLRTPVKKERVRWGKRGLPVHKCEIEVSDKVCGKVFMRAEALRYVCPSVDVPRPSLTLNVVQTPPAQPPASWLLLPA